MFLAAAISMASLTLSTAEPRCGVKSVLSSGESSGGHIFSVGGFVPVGEYENPAAALRRAVLRRVHDAPLGAVLGVLRDAPREGVGLVAVAIQPGDELAAVKLRLEGLRL